MHNGRESRVEFSNQQTGNSRLTCPSVSTQQTDALVTVKQITELQQGRVMRPAAEKKRRIDVVIEWWRVEVPVLNVHGKPGQGE